MVVPSRRKTTSVDITIIDTNTRVRAKLSPGSYPLQEKACSELISK
jgi:hypothetical protein